MKWNPNFISFYKNLFGEAGFQKYETVLKQHKNLIHFWTWKNDDKVLKKLEVLQAEKLMEKFPVYQISDNSESRALVNQYRNSIIFQQALDSQLAVWTTFDKSTQNILDICCSPGSKLSQILYLSNPENSVVIGNDISSSRLITVRDRLQDLNTRNLLLEKPFPT